MSLVFVDVEAPMGVGAPSVGEMTEFGAVAVSLTDRTINSNMFHGRDSSKETLVAFAAWLHEVSPDRPVFVSDNVAFDWQWVNYYCWKHLGYNPLGHSGRRISDFYAGLRHDWSCTQRWKRLRVTKHDHHPVHDALGNAEAFLRILDGER